MADAVATTWIEGMGGVYSPESAFAQGIKNIPKGFFKKLGHYVLAGGKDVAQETGEEILQSGATSIFEMASGTPSSETTFMRQFGTPEAIAETELSIILTVGVLGLSGLHSNKVGAISKAYEQGNFKLAAQLELDAIAEIKGKATGEDAKIFDLINNQLTLYVSPEGQVSPINPNVLQALPPSTDITENVQQDKTIDNNQGNMLQLSSKNQLKLTEPSLPEGGKPRGDYAKPDTKDQRPIVRQNETADLFAKEGYDIEILPDKKGGNGYGLKPDSNPDYLIEGKVFDCYAPNSPSVRNIWTSVKLKTIKQAECIILNIDDYMGSYDVLYKQFKDWPINTLKELLVIKDGKITRWIP